MAIMKSLFEYIKENLDIDNFAYKFDVWFQTDKNHLKPMLELFKDCADRKIVQKDDVDKFIEKYPSFKIKKFVDFFDEDVKRDEAISIDYIYLMTKIIEQFISNFTLFNKIDYMYQSIGNGIPNVEVDPAPLSDNMEKIKEEN